MRIYIQVLFFLLLGAFGGKTQNDLTAKEIIKKAEDKMRGTTSAISEMKITTVRPTWSREMELKSWAKGNDYSLILITSPAKEKGTVFLKREKEVWNWVPSIERTIKLPPSMMGQSWMGTDMTNDDLVRESSNVTDYTHELAGDSTIRGKECYKIILIPKENAPVVYGKVVAFIAKENFVQLRTEMYDEDGYLVSTMIASDIKTMDEVELATKMEMIPADKEGHKTVMEIKDMQFNEPIEDRFFTTQNMKRIK